jgi:protein TonB
MPVPVPEGIADPEQTLAPQNMFSPQTGPAREGTEGEWGEEAPIVIPETEPPPFQIVEEMPKVVRSVAPVYPELAIRSELTGTVYVKIWVDKEGKPREVSVEKSDQEILNDAAIAAAKQFLFTPAYMNSGPVSVWVTIPFRFRLAGRN